MRSGRQSLPLFGLFIDHSRIHSQLSTLVIIPQWNHNSDIHNGKLRAQKHGAETLTAVSQALCLPLRDMVRGYKTELRRLHPFEKVVADLTVRARQKKDGLTLMAILVSSGVVR